MLITHCDGVPRRGNANIKANPVLKLSVLEITLIQLNCVGYFIGFVVTCITISEFDSAQVITIINFRNLTRVQTSIGKINCNPSPNGIWEWFSAFVCILVLYSARGCNLSAGSLSARGCNRW